MKQTTCAIIVRHDREMLLVHSTGLPWNQWGWPKGIQDPGEDAIDTAIRETKEETNFDIPKDQLISLGTFTYRRGEKDMAIYLYDAPSLPDVKTMTCPSTFYCDRKKMDRPEIDGFRMVPFHKLPLYFSPRMMNVYGQIRDVIEA